MNSKNLFRAKPDWVTSKHTTSLTDKLDRERQNLAVHMEDLAAAYGVSPDELYRFFVEFLRTDEDNKLLTWRAARRLTK